MMRRHGDYMVLRSNTHDYITARSERLNGFRTPAGSQPPVYVKRVGNAVTLQESISVKKEHRVPRSVHLVASSHIDLIQFFFQVMGPGPVADWHWIMVEKVGRLVSGLFPQVLVHLNARQRGGFRAHSDVLVA